MILAILQARMTSPRLPGKAMAPLRGEPMIWRQVERIRLSRCVSKLVVATNAEVIMPIEVTKLDNVLRPYRTVTDALDGVDGSQ